MSGAKLRRGTGMEPAGHFELRDKLPRLDVSEVRIQVGRSVKVMDIIRIPTVEEIEKAYGHRASRWQGNRYAELEKEITVMKP